MYKKDMIILMMYIVKKPQDKSDVTKVDGNECYQIWLESGMF